MFPIWVKSLFILNLVLPPYFVAETVVAHPGNTIPQPYCEPYRNVTDCLDTLNPICGDDGKSYDNQCYFCTETLKSYKHLGICTE
uniref:Kazal-like domain-containing protein n=1 Tax=Rattus norvegicus TaxID=10116 RepID=A0A8I6A8P5_RAT